MNYFLEEVLQGDDQLENHQESQNQLLREVVVKKKTLTKKKGQECGSLQEKHLSTTQISSPKRHLKFNSQRKCLKQNIDLPGHIKNYAKKKLDVADEHRKSFSHSLSDTKTQNQIQTGKKQKLSNHS